MEYQVKEKPLRSWSQFSTYMRCPELYRALYVDKEIPRKQSPAALLGSSIHYAHEKLCLYKKNNKLLSLEEAELFAVSYFEENNDGTIPEDEMSSEKDKIPDLVKVYYEYFIDNDITPKETEQKLYCSPEGHDFVLLGVIDRVNNDDSIVDLKTAGKSPPKNKKTNKHYVDIRSGYQMQLDTYIMLARANNYDPKKAGLEVVVKSKNPKVVPVDYPVNEDFLKSTLDLMANLNENMIKGNFPKNRLGTFCSPKYCDNWEACTGIKCEKYSFEV